KEKGNEGVVALDLRVKTTKNPVTNVLEEIPELDLVWAEDVQFVPYTPPPVSESVLDHGIIEEWSERIALIDDDLKWLMSLPHSRFWCQVIFDETLQQFLDSYLQFAPRNFDASVLSPELAFLHENVHKRVFMTYVRMSTHKESKEDFITADTFGDILYENFLFDIPKIMDICTLYGGENSANTPLLRKMLDNIFSKQPKYHSDLDATIPTIYETLDDILSKCGIKYKLDAETDQPQKLSDVRNGPSASLSVRQLEDIVLYLNDTTETLLAFLSTYPVVCDSFVRHGFVQRVAGFYELLVPHFRNCLIDIKSQNLKEKWKHVKLALIKVCHVILHTCCIEPLERGGSSEDQVQSCVENFLQVLTSILSEKRFLSSYDSRFVIKEDLNRIQRCSVSTDETRVEYIMAAVESARRAFPNHVKRKENSTKPHSSTAAFGTENNVVAVNGQFESWIEEDVREVKEVMDERSDGAVSKTVNEAELFSLVSHVQDLLPGLGDGFIILCLEELNYEVEQVINLILEDNLPPCLQNLDRNLSKDEAMKNKKQPVKTVLEQRHSVYDKDDFDVFAGNKLNLSKIHKGKRRDVGSIKKLLSDKSDITESVKERYAAYDVFNRHVWTASLYDDEYDDTYDSQNVGAQDADSADELTIRRPFTTPRVLGGSPEPSNDEEEEDGENEDDPTQKESIAKSQDDQVDKSLVNRRQRGRGHERQGPKKDEANKEGQKGGTRGRGRGVSASESKQRAHNERNKGTRANHNRKAGAAVKRNKGMGMLPSR
ncbi:unnamed protein product, partial [Porites evermanni]